MHVFSRNQRAWIGMPQGEKGSTEKRCWFGFCNGSSLNNKRYEEYCQRIHYMYGGCVLTCRAAAECMLSFCFACYLLYPLFFIMHASINLFRGWNQTVSASGGNLWLFQHSIKHIFF